MSTHRFGFRVSETDLDVFGHVNNAVYLRYFEMARWDFLAKKGMGLEDLIKSGMGPVILEVQLRFLRELKAGDQVLIESHFGAFEKKVARIRQVIFSGGSTEPSAEALFTAAIFDTRQRKIVEPSGVWVQLTQVSEST